MKLKAEDVQQAQNIQIITNSLKLQTLLEMLFDNKIIDEELFNNLLAKKYDTLNDDPIKEEEPKSKTFYKHFGDAGEA